EVENIHRNRMLTPSLTEAILRGAGQIAIPTAISTLAICVVFFPVALLEGPAKFLFSQLALSVVFSMLASYFLSRTLVPTLSRMLMSNGHSQTEEQPKWIQAINAGREKLLRKVQATYVNLIAQLIQERAWVLGIFCAILAISLTLPFF